MFFGLHPSQLVQDAVHPLHEPIKGLFGGGRGVSSGGCFWAECDHDLG